MKISKLTECLGLTEAGIKVLEKRTGNKRQAVRGMFDCYGEHLKKEKSYCSRQISVLDFILIFGDSDIATCVAAHWR